MKKVSKILTLAIVLIMLCVSLCGRADLNTMRERQAFRTEDGSITYDGMLYLSLPDYYDKFSDTITDYIYITEPDVPVLLCDYFGEWAYISDSDIIIGIEDRIESRYYCREDKYDEIIARLDGEIEYGSYCYYYYDIDSDENDQYVLTAEQKNAVDAVLQTAKTVVTEDDMYYYDTFATLEKCSIDGLFTSDSPGELYVSDDSYYILTYDEEITMKYTVPEEYNDIFKEITKALAEAENL